MQNLIKSMAVMHGSSEAFVPEEFHQIHFSNGAAGKGALKILWASAGCIGLRITDSHLIAPPAEAGAVPDDELSLELLLLLLSSDDDESSDDDDEEEDELSSLLLLVSLESSDEASEEPAGFLRFFLDSDLDPGSSLPFWASPGSSSDAPRKRGLYCRCMPPCQFLSHVKAHISKRTSFRKSRSDATCSHPACSKDMHAGSEPLLPSKHQS